MNDSNRIDELERKLQYLTDRQEIRDVVTRVARGNDRFDAELHSSCYHPDGFHEVASRPIPGPEIGEHANSSHGRICQQSLHHVTMQLCEIDGDVAHAESYVIGMFLDNDGKRARILSGRYLDRLEKRNGAWKIAVRRAPVEIIMEGSAAMINMSFFRQRGYLKGVRDRSDLSYARPLGLEDGERWDHNPPAPEL
jgi:hypothetical protein